MKVITFLLHTKQPILVTSFQGDPNSDVSFSYIPGSVIRGLLISRYLQGCGLGKNDDILALPDVKRLFFSGESRYLNAYLYSQEKDKRTLPVPLSWLKIKDDKYSRYGEMNVYDFSYRRHNENLSYKSLDEGFCCIVDDDRDIILYQEGRHINIHNMRNRKKGKGIDGSGAVFRYDALLAGQTFQAAIICDNSDDVEKIKPLLEPSQVWLGGSQSAGYGYIEIDNVEEFDNWSELGIDASLRGGRKLLRVTLLSDLILLDKWGHYIVNPEAELVTELLQEYLDVGLELQDSYTSTVLVGGFNRKWGLPLPQVPAFASGSVFVFSYSGELKAEKILNLENRGIGERRVDGFGRVAINWLEELPYFIAKLLDNDVELEEAKLEAKSEDQNIAVKMAERLLAQKLDRLLLEKVDSLYFNPCRLTNSQLSRLMIVAQQSLTEKTKSLVLELLKKLPRNANSQFEDSKLDGVSFKRKIIEWLDNPSSWIDSQHLQVSIAGEGAASEVVEKLKLEYTLRLIIAIAKQATKDKKYE
ncbi:MAG: hypothetical protein KME29_31530 [Calothrix sp. FI2-JRJ7]|jgi:CRISPR-associated protein Csx10|nr:hypothetical protein [Calothrix sp. FI2-JRJ7]